MTRMNKITHLIAPAIWLPDCKDSFRFLPQLYTNKSNLNLQIDRYDWYSAIASVLVNWQPLPPEIYDQFVMYAMINFIVWRLTNLIRGAQLMVPMYCPNFKNGDPELCYMLPEKQGLWNQNYACWFRKLGSSELNKIIIIIIIIVREGEK